MVLVIKNLCVTIKKVRIGVRDINETPILTSQWRIHSQLWGITKMTATVIFWEFDDSNKGINLQPSCIVPRRRSNIANDDVR